MTKKKAGAKAPVIHTGVLARQLVDDTWHYLDFDVQVASAGSLIAFGFNLVAFDDYLCEPGWDVPKAAANRVRLLRSRASLVEAWKEKNNLAIEGWLNYLQTVMQYYAKLNELLPLAQRDAAFHRGRKVGTVGAVRLAIRAYLKRHPGATPAHVWAGLAAKPPKALTFFDNRLGKYIEVAGASDTQYRRFANIVSEERQAILTN